MKHKTHKGLSKRLKLTGAKKNKKIMHEAQYDNHHLRSKKSSQKKNRMAGESSLTKTDKSKVILKWI